jgi:UDP-glucuronate 4-epimerase
LEKMRRCIKLAQDQGGTLGMRDDCVLVTGAAGLVGNAVRVMLENANRRVVAIDRMGGRIQGRDVTECDVTDIHGLHGIARRNHVTGIVHCGAFSGPMVAADNPAQMVQVNIVGTANILELARIVGGTRVVFCSSTSAYGPTPRGPVSEDVALKPSTVYGASKAASEHLVHAYAKQHSVDGVSLRLSWIYGPRRTTACTIRAMITDALGGRPTRLPFGRDFPRQYIHIDDAANALVTALDKRTLPRSTYTVTGGTWMTLGEIAGIVRKVMPLADIEVADGPDPVDDRQERFDISAAARDLGYSPRVSLEDGIRDYRVWLETNASAPQF